MTRRLDLEHSLKNHLAIILGFSELLLEESDAEDPRRPDFEQIHKAGAAAAVVVAALGVEEP